MYGSCVREDFITGTAASDSKENYCMVDGHIRGVILKFPKYINKNYYVLSGSYSAPSP
jgi:hypothetical protein